MVHVAHAFVPAGFVLQGLAVIGLLPVSAGVHAWMVGAAGLMTLAVMTRASLGHTDRALIASNATRILYATVFLAALARICAAIEPGSSSLLLHVAALTWGAGFVGFGIVYRPTLWRVCI
jgi:uncharacterized protein involved in response to NO